MASRSAFDRLQLDGGVAAFPGWSLIEVGGRHRERFLASQLTSDVVGLAIGESQPSALLDRSGRLQAFFFVRRRSDAIDLLVPEAAARLLIDTLEAHIIADDVTVERRHVGAMRLVLGAAAAAMGPGEDRFPVIGWGSKGFVTWGDADIDLPKIATDELESLRVLGGPPAWGREVRPGQVVNETALLESAVSFDKGCYLGQETVAKIASHRGAARGPLLLEASGVDLDPDLVVGRWFRSGGRDRAGEVLSATRWRGAVWLSVSVHRELRVAGREREIEFPDGTALRVVTHSVPHLSPPTPDTMAERLTVAASAAFADDRSDRALELLDRAIAVCPAFADAVEASGVILGRLGRHHEAIERMERLVEVDPSSVMAHSNLSLFYNQLGDIERAEHHLAVATRLSMGGTAEPMDDPHERIETDRERRETMFRQVLEIDPADPLAHFGLGELAVERGRYTDAVTHLEKAVASDPTHAAAMLALGAALEGLGESDRAREIYERGVETAAKRGDLTTATKMQERLNALQR